MKCWFFEMPSITTLIKSPSNLREVTTTSLHLLGFPFELPFLNNMREYGLPVFLYRAVLLFFLNLMNVKKEIEKFQPKVSVIRPLAGIGRWEEHMMLTWQLRKSFIGRPVHPLSFVSQFLL